MPSDFILVEQGGEFDNFSLAELLLCWSITGYGRRQQAWRFFPGPLRLMFADAAELFPLLIKSHGLIITDLMLGQSALTFWVSPKAEGNAMQATRPQTRNISKKHIQPLKNAWLFSKESVQIKLLPESCSQIHTHISQLIDTIHQIQALQSCWLQCEYFYQSLFYDQKDQLPKE